MEPDEYAEIGEQLRRVWTFVAQSPEHIDEFVIGEPPVPGTELDEYSGPAVDEDIQIRVEFAAVEQPGEPHALPVASGEEFAVGVADLPERTGSWWLDGEALEEEDLDTIFESWCSDPSVASAAPNVDQPTSVSVGSGTATTTSSTDPPIGNEPGPTATTAPLPTHHG